MLHFIFTVEITEDITGLLRSIFLRIERKKKSLFIKIRKAVSLATYQRFYVCTRVKNHMVVYESVQHVQLCSAKLSLYGQ